MMTSRKLSVEEERESWAQLFAVVIRYEEEMAGNWLRQKTGHLNGATRFRNHRCTNRIAWQVTGITSKAAISDSVMFDPNQFINLGHFHLLLHVRFLAHLCVSLTTDAALLDPLLA